MAAIARGEMEPPVPNVRQSKVKKRAWEPRLGFEQRTRKGQRKLVKLWVLEQMAQASRRGPVLQAVEPVVAPVAASGRSILSLKPRAPETAEEAQARVKRVNKALIADLKLDSSSSGR
jgi:hypothetical protein